MTEGWKCSECGTVYAPFIRECNCSRNVKPTISSVSKVEINFPCLWDGMSETAPGSGIKIGWLSCPCPKCSPRC